MTGVHVLAESFKVTEELSKPSGTDKLIDIHRTEVGADVEETKY